MIKILHVFFAKSKVSSGILNQLSFEEKAAKKLSSCLWDTKHWIPGRYNKDYIEEFNPGFISVLINNIKFYFWLNKVSSNYDYIIIRYPTYDPFAFLLNLKCKHLTIHHTKELDENKYYRYALIKKLIEKYISRRLITTASGVIGVTSEVAFTSAKKSRINIPTYVFPNGVDFESIKVAEKVKAIKKNYINLLFVASSFPAWHGLDRIIQSVSRDSRFRLFVIGNYTSKDLLFENEKIEFLGYKNNEEINNIAKKCHIALGCFGLDRKNLSEAATLKVREYLAMGIPVYSGTKDSSIPFDFPYYSFTLHKFDNQFLINFYNKTKNVSRVKIRSLSEQYISKFYIMEKFVSCLIKEKL